MLDRLIKGSLPRGSNTRWNFYVRTVSKVRQYLEPIKECFEEIKKENRNSKVVRKASGFLSFLNGPNTKFWLTLFEKILINVDILFKTMQNPKITASSIKNSITHFSDSMQSIRSSELTVHSAQSIQAEAIEICDRALVGCQERFKFTNHLLLAQLLRKEFFENRNEREFQQILDSIPEFYPSLDRFQLENELEVFYSRPEMHFEDLSKLLKYIEDLRLHTTLKELKKLVLLLITIPMTTTEPERKFSTLSRIKDKLRSTMKNPRLNALSILSMEQKLFRCSEVDFKELVITHFIQKKERRMDFGFKR